MTYLGMLGINECADCCWSLGPSPEMRGCSLTGGLYLILPTILPICKTGKTPLNGVKTGETLLCRVFGLFVQDRDAGGRVRL